MPSPGIDSRPDICGGAPCIVRTRIPVWVLVRAKQMGVTEADLLRSYPTLRAIIREVGLTVDEFKALA
jgi:uncharacterized protein (DUF433 family)